MKIKAVIDRIEDQEAVIRFKNFRGEIILPVKALPQKVGQGSVLNFILTEDKKETGQLEKEIIDILKDLDESS